METSSEFRAAGAENLRSRSFYVARTARPLAAAAAADWHSQQLIEPLSNGSKRERASEKGPAAKKKINK